MAQLSGGVVGRFVDVGWRSVERERDRLRREVWLGPLERSGVHLVSSCSSFRVTITNKRNCTGNGSLFRACYI
jgi:hypothetical protein